MVRSFYMHTTCSVSEWVCACVTVHVRGIQKYIVFFLEYCKFSSKLHITLIWSEQRRRRRKKVKWMFATYRRWHYHRCYFLPLFHVQHEIIKNRISNETQQHQDGMEWNGKKNERNGWTNTHFQIRVSDLVHGCSGTNRFSCTFFSPLVLLLLWFCSIVCLFNLYKDFIQMEDGAMCMACVLLRCTWSLLFPS